MAYSFYPTKNLGGIGDGGAVVTDDGDLAAHVTCLRVHGMAAHYVHEEVAQSFRMSEIEAAWLRIALPLLEADNDRRRAIAAAYRSAAPELRWQADHRDHVHHLACSGPQTATRFRRDLAARDVATAVHYPLAITQQPAYRHLARQGCPESEAWAAECVTVPCFPEMTDDEVEVVAGALHVDRAVSERARNPLVQSLSACFPCYNDAETIGSMVDEVHAALAPIVDDLEVVVANDASQDRSGAVLDEMATARPWLRVVHHEVNRGYGGALRSAFAGSVEGVGLLHRWRCPVRRLRGGRSRPAGGRGRRRGAGVEDRAGRRLVPEGGGPRRTTT